MPTTIYIHKKCPKGENSGHGTEECPKHHRHYNVSLTNVYNPPEDPKYRVCRRKRNGINIHSLRYGESDLIDADGSKLIGNRRINELSVYYSATYDSDDEEIERPLALRFREYETNTYHWYENKGDPSNTIWNAIPGEEPLYGDGKPTPAFKGRLDHLTCQLHNLYSVDIFKGSNYRCPVCHSEDTKVTVYRESFANGYTKYKHEYKTKPDSVKYNNAILKYRDPEDDNGESTNEYKLIPLSEHIHNLFVYYWDQDREHKRPLLMEVGVFGTMPVSLGNDGKPYNREWTTIGDHEPGEPVSADTLHEQKCRLFRPVDINISEKGPYANKYCEERSSKRGGCPQTIEVTNYPISSLKNYTAKKHTYGGEGDNKNFTVTDFKGGPKVPFPIFDVTEVVVFLTECNQPLLVYVKSSDDGKTHKWYSRAKKDNGANRWEENTELKGRDPHEVSKDDTLKTALEGIKSGLELGCSDEQKQKLNKAKAQPPPVAKVRATAKECTIEKLLEKAVGDIVSLLDDSAALGTFGLGAALAFSDALLTSKGSKDIGEKEPETPPFAEKLRSQAESSEERESENGSRGIGGHASREAKSTTRGDSYPGPLSPPPPIPPTPSVTYSETYIEEHGNTIKHNMYGNFVEEYYNTVEPNLHGYSPAFEIDETDPPVTTVEINEKAEVIVPIDVSYPPKTVSTPPGLEDPFAGHAPKGYSIPPDHQEHADSTSTGDIEQRKTPKEAGGEQDGEPQSQV
ncbi:hypothetical protein BEWA_037070 [Theileria equi strain WA]|uniref:Uncharacterized protein n=1 Tax=Theileria equi strain WA TaxID=1537102 RepID=L1LE98_THEEQ|nr:hypothetical protein BEWA_037070 [Theileria equi strain WA]EKX73671.1 hypothetical protein BEWA_037070 [Theileria equi strain WA]|eukprot:XP_004833123.1 hypothetical protein BEWA_037070 [Theileria equi strain WA]